MTNIVFVPRHEMTKDQEYDLIKMIGADAKNVEFSRKNLTWAASSNVSNDVQENWNLWTSLFEEFDIVTGVFPPVALESLEGHTRRSIYTPVSEQSAHQRADGSTKIEFVHLRWARL